MQVFYAVLPILIVATFVTTMLVAGLRELILTGKCCLTCCGRCCACMLACSALNGRGTQGGDSVV
jgi:hypothetical protein